MIDYKEFKGNKMIVLMKNVDDDYPFQFGKAKAKLIVENFAAIKEFAEKDE